MRDIITTIVETEPNEWEPLQDLKVKVQHASAHIGLRCQSSTVVPAILLIAKWWGGIRK